MEILKMSARGVILLTARRFCVKRRVLPQPRRTQLPVRPRQERASLSGSRRRSSTIHSREPPSTYFVLRALALAVGNTE